MRACRLTAPPHQRLLHPYRPEALRRPSAHHSPAGPGSTAAGGGGDGVTLAVNDTEYAFGKSKTLISRILHSTGGRKTRLASMALFVFAVLYVFQNEVSLRVARTVSKRLKRLAIKVNRGEEEISEKDMELLRGWRWRVLLWQ